MALNGLFWWLGQRELIVLCLGFTVWLLLGHIVRRYLEIASWAAAERKWKARLASDFLTALYAVCIFALGFFPLIIVLKIMFPNRLVSPLLEGQAAPAMLPGLVSLAALLWALYYLAMAITATGATYHFIFNPLTVVRWIWKCFPHMTLCFLLLPIYTAVTTGLVLLGLGWAVISIDPSARKEAEAIIEHCEELFEQMQKDPEHIHERRRQWENQGRQHAASFHIDDKDLHACRAGLRFRVSGL